MKEALNRVLVTMALSLASMAASAQVAVIVNPKNPAASMTADQVSSIFLGRTNTLPSGAAAAMADLPESSPTYEQFYSKVTGRSGAQVKSIWARLTFSGKATPPKAFGSSAEVKKFVASTPDAIGYIEKSALDSTVKAVLTVD